MKWPFVALAVVAGAAAGYSAAAFRPHAAPDRPDLSALEGRLDALARSSEEQTRTLSELARARAVERVVAQDAPNAGSKEPAAEARPEEARREEENPEASAAKGDGELMIARAVEVGRWTDENEDDFHQLRLAHPEVDWTPVLTSLSAAMNNGKLVPPALARRE